MEEHNYTWSLGDDSDCETCGWSYNEAGLELWDEEDYIWQLYCRVGCYGGDSVLSNDPEWNTKVEEMIETYRRYSGFTKSDEKELREKLKLVGETK